MRGILHDRDIDRPILGNERELGQVNLVELIKRILPYRWISGRELLIKESICLLVAPEGIILSAKAIGRRGDRSTVQRA